MAVLWCSLMVQQDIIYLGLLTYKSRNDYLILLHELNTCMLLIYMGNSSVATKTRRMGKGLTSYFCNMTTDNKHEFPFIFIIFAALFPLKIGKQKFKRTMTEKKSTQDLKMLCELEFSFICQILYFLTNILYCMHQKK